MFKNITPLQERDSCFALVFLFLLVWLFMRLPWLVYVAMGLLLLGMIWPGAYRPFAWCWFGLAQILGKIFSTILLGIIWLLLVVPIGLVRRMIGKDPLKLKDWKKGDQTLFVNHDHQYGPDDFKNPY